MRIHYKEGAVMEKINAVREAKNDRNATDDPYVMGEKDPGATAGVGGVDQVLNAERLAKMDKASRDKLNAERTAFADEAVAALLRQGKASLRKVDGMMVGQYRGDGGCKCIIGHFIADKDYKPSWDEQRRTINDLYLEGEQSIIELDAKLGGKGDGARFMRFLQMAHDNSALRDGRIGLRKFMEQITAVGMIYKLDLSKSLRMIKDAMGKEAEANIIIHDKAQA